MLWSQLSCGVSYGGRIRWRPPNNHIMFVPRTLVIPPRFASPQNGVYLLFLSLSSLFFSFFPWKARGRERNFLPSGNYTLCGYLPTPACTRLIYFFLRSQALSPLEVASRSSLLALAVESGNIPPEGTFTSVDASANFGTPRTFCCGTIIGNVPFSIFRTFSLDRSGVDSFLTNI